MRSRKLLVLALTGVVAAACARDEANVEDEVAPGAETPPAAEPAVPAGDVVVAMGTFEKAPAAGERNIVGTAELVRTGTEPTSPFELKARLEGLVQDVEHAWHIHRGACGTADAPIAIAITPAQGQDAIGDPMKAGADGVAEQTVRIPTERLTQQQLETETYSVHVHDGTPAQPGAAIACANLQRR